jgi:ABC-type branched-subunit amino acid transport system substrate-binding protein
MRPEPRHAFVRRVVAALSALALLAVVSACSTAEQAGLVVSTQGSAPVTPQHDRIGSGATIIGVIARDEPGNLSDGRPDSIYLSAQLAAQTLPKNAITFDIRKLEGSERAARRAAEQLAEGGAKIIIGDAGTEALAGVKEALAGNRVPLVTLSGRADASARQLTAGFSSREEAAAIAAEAQRRGYGSLVIVFNEEIGAQLFSNQILSEARKLDIAVRAVSGKSADEITRRLLSGEGAHMPSALVFATGPVTASAIMRILRADLRWQGVQLVGNAGWALTSVLPSELGGSWYAVPANNSLPAYARKFTNAFGASPTLNSALTYDLLIMAATLPDLVPSEPYATDVLTNPQGFRGFSGHFRFTGNGSAGQRDYVIVAIP